MVFITISPQRKGNRVADKASVTVGSCADPSGAGADLAALLAQLREGRLFLRASSFVSLEIIGCDRADTTTSSL